MLNVCDRPMGRFAVGHSASASPRCAIFARGRVLTPFVAEGERCDLPTDAEVRDRDRRARRWALRLPPVGRRLGHQQRRVPRRRRRAARHRRADGTDHGAQLRLRDARCLLGAVSPAHQHAHARRPHERQPVHRGRGDRGARAMPPGDARRRGRAHRRTGPARSGGPRAAPGVDSRTRGGRSSPRCGRLHRPRPTATA